MVKIRKISIFITACVVLSLAYVAMSTAYASSSDAPSGGPRIGSCPVFPSDNPWNRDISHDPVAPNSANIVAYINGGGKFLGYAFGNWPEYGMPYNIVPGSQPKVPIKYRQWDDQSDPGPMPVPRRALVEGAGKVYADRHVIVVDKDRCMLYELHNAVYNGVGWTADSGAAFNLRSNQMRPAGWTSADAAGLPIFPGLIRYDEITTGAINHALRFVVANGRSRDSFVYPATHSEGTNLSPYAPPMGTRVRLKASFDISHFTGKARIILQALKKYGMILADESKSSWTLWGMSSPNWDHDDLAQLEKVPGTAFEVVAPQYSPAVVAAASTTALKLQYKTGDGNPLDNRISPVINIVNTGSGYGVLSELTIRYYFSNEMGTTADVACVSAPMGCDTLKFNIVKMPKIFPNADHYVEIGFNARAGTVFSGRQTGGIQIRINKLNWTPFNERNDYSYNSALRTFADWRRVVLYRKGKPIWGAEPSLTVTTPKTPTRIPTLPRPVGVPTNTPVPRTTPTRAPTSVGRLAIGLQYKAVSTNTTDNQIAPAFNLVNTGTIAVRYSDIKIRYWFTRDTGAEVRYRCLAAPMTCNRVSGHVYRMSPVLPGAEYYMELTFTADAGYLRPGMQSGPIQINVFKSDFSNFNEANDFSFDGTKANFAYWQKIAVYNAGAKIWGLEPR